MEKSEMSVRGENGNPIQYSCLQNPVDSGAWWAATYGVAQSRTRLKQLSMHACIGKGNGNPLQYSCLQNPVDRGAWWAAVHRVAQSQTQLKQLSVHACKDLIYSTRTEPGLRPRFCARTQVGRNHKPGLQGSLD